MAKCEICGKKPMTGHNVSFSQRHTKRQWKPNIQKATIMRNGKPKGLFPLPAHRSKSLIVTPMGPNAAKSLKASINAGLFLSVCPAKLAL